MRFEMRVAAGADAAKAYAAALDMASWADRLEFERVKLNEHHATEYGYLPARRVFRGAVAGRTVRYGTEAVVVAALHDPLALAEAAAVHDLTLVAVYRPDEFLMSASPSTTGPRRWTRSSGRSGRPGTGAPVGPGGSRVTPSPAQQPHPPCAWAVPLSRPRAGPSQA